MDDPGRHASHDDPSFDGLPIDWNDPAWGLADLLSGPNAVTHVVHSNDGTTEGASISPNHASPLEDRAQVAANNNAAGHTRSDTQVDRGQLGATSALYIQAAPPEFSWAELQQPLSNVGSATRVNTAGWIPPSTTVISGPPPHSAVAGPIPPFSFGQPMMGFNLVPDPFSFSFMSIPPPSVRNAQATVPDGDPLPPDLDAFFNVKADPGWTQGQGVAFVGTDPSPFAALPAQYTPTPALAPSGRRTSSSSRSPGQARPSSRGQKREPKGSPSLEFIMVQPNNGLAEIPRKRLAVDPLASRTLKRITCEDANGEVRGAMITLELKPPEHHRSRFSPEKRAETNLARKEGVCSRCQGSKRKCDLALKDSLYVPCTRCSTSKLYKGMSPMPCFRSILKDIMFFRAGPAANEPMFTNRFKRLAIDDISKPNVPVRDLHLTQRISNHKLTVYASEFVPLPNDKVSLKWKNKDGSHGELRMPTFCLTNMQKVTAQVEQYIYEAKRSYLEALLEGEELVSMTVRMAAAYAQAKTNSLVSMALDLWAISRMIEIEWEMCGPDTLGIQRFSDPLNPRDGKIPIPPMMDTQLDQIVILNVLNPLRKRLLDQLEARISPFKREDWFDIYLTSFIVLNHIERLAKHSAYHAELHCMSTKFSNLPFLVSVFHSAKVVLSRFHFVCNGSAPLRLDWDSPASAALAKLDPKQTAFMKQTQALIKARETDLVCLRTHYDYGRSLYWSSQLFTENWDNSPARVVEVIPAVN